MAVAILVPWPGTPAAVAAAVACLTAATTMSVTQAERFGPVAADMVTRYGSAAPQSTLNEAVIRTATYLRSRPGSEIIDVKMGPGSVTYGRFNSRDPLRASGAEAILSRFKSRNVGIVK